MRDPITPVSSRYGAPIGRPSLSMPPVTNEALEPKVSLRRIKLDRGGYDKGGAYWGTGKPLYWAGSDCGKVDKYFRARDRDAAKAVIRGYYPLARFYR